MPEAEKKKTYTTTTERKSFGELFWSQRKTFQAGGGYKNPIKTTKTNDRNLSSVDPIFGLQRKILYWSRALYSTTYLHTIQFGLRVPPSRYTCRATRVAADFLDFIAFCRCSSGVAPHSLKILVSHLSPPIPGRCRTESWV